MDGYGMGDNSYLMSVRERAKQGTNSNPLGMKKIKINTRQSINESTIVAYLLRPRFDTLARERIEFDGSLFDL